MPRNRSALTAIAAVLRTATATITPPPASPTGPTPVHTLGRLLTRQRARRAAYASVVVPILAAALAHAPHVAAGVSVAPPARASTVLTLEPLNFNLSESTPTALQGRLCAPPNNCIHVKRPNVIDTTQGVGLFYESGALHKGAMALEAILADGDPALAAGVSQGSQVIARWLRVFAPDSEVDPATVSFLLIADPANTYGVPWAPKVPQHSGFDVTELWRQYDGWADFPNRLDPLALANAVYGIFFVHPVSFQNVDPEDPSIIEWSVNGIDYRMVPSAQLPILDPLRGLGMGWLADMLNDPLKAHVEKAYDRPGTQEQADLMYPAKPVGQPVAAAVVAEEEPVSGDRDGDLDNLREQAGEDELADEEALEDAPPETGAAEDELDLVLDEEADPVEEADEVEMADEVEETEQADETGQAVDADQSEQSDSAAPSRDTTGPTTADTHPDPDS